MIRILPTILILLVSAVGYAQVDPDKFGKIPEADLESTFYPADTTAGVVILSDFGEFSVYNNQFIFFTRHIRIKFYSTQDLSWADFNIPHVESAMIEELQASTFNMVGGKVREFPLDKTTIFKEKVVKGIQRERFAMPNIVKGSIVDIRYKIRTRNIVDIPEWRFQSTIPTRRSEFWGKIPSVYGVQKHLYGFIPATVYEQLDQETYHWIFTEVPAFKSEQYMPDQSNYVSRVKFSLSYIQNSKIDLTSWGKIGAFLARGDDLGKVIKNSGFIREEVVKLVGAERDTLKMTQRLIAHIRGHMEWNGENGIGSAHPDQAYKKGKGSVADINLILLAMLKEAGIASYPIVLSSRENAMINHSIPSLFVFDYLVCFVHINGKDYFTDGSSRTTGEFVLPERCLNGEGLLVSSNNAVWIDLTGKTKKKTVTTGQLTIGMDGVLSGTVSYLYDGYAASGLRDKLAKENEDVVRKKLLSGKDWVVESDSLDLGQGTNGIVRHKVSCSSISGTTLSQNLIYVSPIFDLAEDAAWLVEDRIYPIDFGSALEKTIILKLALKDGLEVESLPAAKLLTLPGAAGKYTYSAAVVGGQINLSSTLSINKPFFTADDYLTLREFLQQVIAKQADAIVLKKK